MRVAFHRSAQVGLQGHVRERPTPESLLLAPQKLQGILEELVPHVAPIRLQQLINLCPANGDGLIELAEFLIFCAGTAPARAHSPLRLRDLSLSSPSLRRKAVVPVSGVASSTQRRQRRRQQQMGVPQSPAQARALARVRAAAKRRAQPSDKKQCGTASAVSAGNSMSASTLPSQTPSSLGSTSLSARFSAASLNALLY